MPDRYQHLQRAKDNENLALQLNRKHGFCVDWAITMVFYAALHYIDAYLAGKGLHPSEHRIRDDEVENNGALSPIFKDYRRLKDLSRAARYDIPAFPVEKLEVARAKLDSIKRHLGAFRK